MSNLDGPPYYDSGLGDVPVPAAVAPLGTPPDGSFGSMRTSCVVGGAKMVNDLTSRDAIPSGLRAEGMTCFVQATGSTYQLQGGVTNADWAVFGASAGAQTLAQTLVLGNVTGATNLLMQSRLEEAKGADVASGTTITLGDGNYFQITGTGTIDGIVTTTWQSGSEVSLYFVAAATVTNNAAVPGVGAAVVLTATGTDFVAAAGNVLTLRYDSALTAWVEQSLATAGGGATPDLQAVMTAGSTGTVAGVVSIASSGAATTLAAGAASALGLQGGSVAVAAGAGTAAVTGSSGASLTATTGTAAVAASAGAVSLSATTGVLLNASRLEEAKGADVASATTITLGAGNYFQVTGTGTIDGILTTNWQSGSDVTLYFVAAATVTNNSGAPGVGAAAILTADGSNFVATAGNMLTLRYDSALSAWVEQCRGAAGGSGGGETLAQTLVLGNVTGGTSVVVTSGDAISGQTVVTTGGTLPLRGGLATLAAGAGGPVVISTAAGGAGTTYVERVRVTAPGTSFFGDGTINATQGAGSAGTPIFAYRSASSTVAALFSFSPGATDSGILVLGHARGTPASPSIVADGDDVGIVAFQAQQDATSVANCAFIRAQIDGIPGASADMPGRISVWTTPNGSSSPIERSRLTNAGVYQIGNGTISQAYLGSFAGLREVIYAPDNTTTQTVVASFSSTAGDAPVTNFVRGRGTAATPAIVVNGDALGYIGFFGVSNSAANMTGAVIRCDTDGAWSDATSSPGRLSFSTTPSGSVTSVERQRISQDGNVLFTTLGAQAVSVNDSGNTAFTGSAAGATSLVGAINQVAAGTGTGAVVGIGSSRGTGASRTLATLPSNLITAAGDRIELEARGDIDTAGTFLFGIGGTTLFTSTSVAPGGAAYVAMFTLVRVTDTTADWWATLLVEGSVAYSYGATAATVPSLTGVNATPNCSVTGGTSTALNLTGTAIKA